MNKSNHSLTKILKVLFASAQVYCSLFYICYIYGKYYLYRQLKLIETTMLVGVVWKMFFKTFKNSKENDVGV